MVSASLCLFSGCLNANPLIPVSDRRMWLLRGTALMEPNALYGEIEGMVAMTNVSDQAQGKSPLGRRRARPPSHDPIVRLVGMSQRHAGDRPLMVALGIVATTAISIAVPVASVIASMVALHWFHLHVLSLQGHS